MFLCQCQGGWKETKSYKFMILTTSYHVLFIAVAGNVKKQKQMRSVPAKWETSRKISIQSCIIFGAMNLDDSLSIILWHQAIVYHRNTANALFGVQNPLFLENFLCFLLIFEMFNEPYLLIVPWQRVAYFERTGLTCMYYCSIFGSCGMLRIYVIETFGAYPIMHSCWQPISKVQFGCNESRVQISYDEFGCNESRVKISYDYQSILWDVCKWSFAICYIKNNQELFFFCEN